MKQIKQYFVQKTWYGTLDGLRGTGRGENSTCFGVGSKFIFSESGHVAYQINWNGTKSTMQAQIRS